MKLFDNPVFTQMIRHHRQDIGDQSVSVDLEPESDSGEVKLAQTAVPQVISGNVSSASSVYMTDVRRDPDYSKQPGYGHNYKAHIEIVEEVTARLEQAEKEQATLRAEQETICKGRMDDLEHFTPMMSDKNEQFEENQKEVQELKKLVEELRVGLSTIHQNRERDLAVSMSKGNEKVEALEKVVQEQLRQMEIWRQQVNVPLVEAIVVEPMDASWQFPQPIAPTGVLLNEQQEQVFQSGKAFSGGNDGVLEESNAVDYGDAASPLSAHDTSPGSPVEVSEPASSPTSDEEAITPRAAPLARRAYQAVLGKKEKKGKK